MKKLKTLKVATKLSDRLPAMAFFINLVVLFLLSGLAKVLYVLWIRRFWIRWMMARQGIRGPPPHFLYGNNRHIDRLNKEAMEKPMSNLSHDILPHVLPHVTTWTKAYGKNFLNWLGTDAQLVVTEPELIKEVLNNKEKVFLKDAAHGFLKRILGDGLILSEGDKWANMRKLANHAFHGESLKGMVLAMVDSTWIMLERWKDCEGMEIDMSKQFTTLTSEVITRTAFGSSYMEGRRIFDMLTRLADLASKNILDKGIPGIRGIWKTADQAEGDRLEKGLHDAFLELMEKREEEVNTGEIDGFGNDFLGMLMQALHGTDDLKRISANDVIDECKTFYSAGRGTTATLLAWTTFLLAAHPEWQDAARKEALEVFGHKDPSADGLARLRTMNMIVNESLRLYPPVVAILRKIHQQTRVGDLVIPANTLLYIPILALHHNPGLWGQDVLDFKPERFAEGVAKATRNNASAFIPFGLGARQCVGMSFAQATTKVAICMILQRYSFTLSPAHVHCPTQYLTNRPQHGVQVILHQV